MDNETDNAEIKKDVPDVIMLPPTMLMLFITAGIALDWIIPLGFGHGWGWVA